MFVHHHEMSNRSFNREYYRVRLAVVRHIGGILETESPRNRNSFIRNEANLTHSEPVGGIATDISSGTERSEGGDTQGDDGGGDDPDSDRRQERQEKPARKVRHSCATAALPLPSTGFVRLPQILAVIPIGKSTWWAGCRSGRFPAPIRLSPGITVWRAEDIHALIQSP